MCGLCEQFYSEDCADALLLVVVGACLFLRSSLDVHFSADIMALDMVESLFHVISHLKVDTVARSLVVSNDAEFLRSAETAAQ